MALQRAETSDEELEKYAVQYTKIFNLPADRAAVVTRANQVSKILAKEHLNWCRHIDVLEELAHRSSPETFYARDPNLVGRCNNFDFQSNFRNPDLDITISNFKKGFCDGCTEQSPLLESSETGKGA